MKIKWTVLFLLFVLLVYTRFVNLSWGLPYPFHPDERNMAMAASEISLRKIYSPNFWSYGGFQINLGHAVALLLNQEAVISLRLISASASVLTVLFAYQILKKVFEVKNRELLLLPFIFSPALIQFAHFGTTESLLMLVYVWLIYECLLFMKGLISSRHFIIIASLVSGISMATKISSVIFIVLPLTVFVFFSKKKFFSAMKYILLTLILTVVFSPHYLFYWQNFLGSLLYERSIVTGKLSIFYTRQFFETIPIAFQFENIFPYALGWPVVLFFVVSFLILPYSKTYNFLRFAFLVYFLPNAFLFAKWTRFIAPIMPLMIVFAILFLLRIKIIKIIKVIAVIVIILPGIAYLSIYQNSDVRFVASSWINKNIPENSYVLSETANVVDIPITNPNHYNVIPFDFYNLDEDHKLQSELDQHLVNADYIFVPSRRVFMNHLKNKYPLLDKYYNDLFSNRLGFKKVAEFSSYPRISILGRTLIEFPDEQAEETWTVFDHPVIRIFKKI